MPRKTIIIFISVFILVGGVVFGYYYFSNQTGTTTNVNTDTTSGYPSFNPFGSGTTVNTQEGTSTASEEISVPAEGTPTQTTSRFSKITDFAIAGATYFEDTRQIIEPTKDDATTAETTTVVKKTTTTKKPQPKFETVPSLRYIERATGHIYQMPLDTKTVEKISNSTIPSIYETIFDNKASTIIYRYLSESGDTINSYMATLGGTKGGFLVSDILDLSTSPDKTKFFYLVKNTNGVTGTIKSFSETKSSNIFSSPFSEWLSQWVTSQKIFLTTKASWNTEGNLFGISTLNGSISKIFGGVKGLTTLASTDGTLVLYNSTTDSGPKLGVFNIKNHTTEDIKVYGLPEKCVWSNDKITIYCALPKTITGNQYPDSWYQGLVSFDDYFVKIDTNKNIVTTIADSIEGTPVDGTHLFLSKDETKIFFTNKKDSTLWSLDIQ